MGFTDFDFIIFLVEISIIYDVNESNYFKKKVFLTRNISIDKNVKMEDDFTVFIGKRCILSTKNLSLIISISKHWIKKS